MHLLWVLLCVLFLFFLFVCYCFSIAFSLGSQKDKKKARSETPQHTHKLRGGRKYPLEFQQHLEAIFHKSIKPQFCAWISISHRKGQRNIHSSLFLLSWSLIFFLWASPSPSFVPRDLAASSLWSCDNGSTLAFCLIKAESFTHCQLLGSH